MIVKVTTYAGTVAAPISNRIADENLHMLKQPYLSHEAIEVTGSPVSSSPAPKDAFLVQVDIQAGKTICCEVNPDGQGKPATQASPWLSGKNILHFGSGWTLSMVETG